jgi:hypothetical protein
MIGFLRAVEPKVEFLLISFWVNETFEIFKADGVKLSDAVFGV